MKVRQDASGWQVDFIWKYHKSEIRQTMCLYEENPRIDFKTEVDWQEQPEALKDQFPGGCARGDARFDIRMEISAVRSREIPAGRLPNLKWLLISGWICGRPDTVWLC